MNFSFPQCPALGRRMIVCNTNTTRVLRVRLLKPMISSVIRAFDDTFAK